MPHRTQDWPISLPLTSNVAPAFREIFGCAIHETRAAGPACPCFMGRAGFCGRPRRPLSWDRIGPRGAWIEGEVPSPMVISGAGRRQSPSGLSFQMTIFLADRLLGFKMGAVPFCPHIANAMYKWALRVFLPFDQISKIEGLSAPARSRFAKCAGG